MQKLAPYNNLEDALKLLDNGGNFYNLFTKAEDGVISLAEVGKIAGLFNDRQQNILFLEMSIENLEQAQKDKILGSLDDELKTAFRKYKSQHLLPSEANQYGVVSSNAIITGIPKLTTSSTKFSGFIMIPIMAGGAMSFTLIPIMEKYDIYEVRDESSSEDFLIAHSKSSSKLPEERMKIGGVIKEMKLKEKEKEASGKFLEALYYIDIDDEI